MADNKTPPPALVIGEQSGGMEVLKEVAGDKYKIAVRVSQVNLNPPFSVLARISANDVPLHTVEVKGPKNVTFEVSKDKIQGDQVTIKVTRAGIHDDKGDSLAPISLGKAKETRESADERFALTSGKCGPDGLNPISFLIKDEKNQPVAGHVRISCGQKFQLNGASYKAGTITCGVPASGQYAANIKLSKQNETLTFHWVEGNITKRALCLRKV